MTTLPKKQSTFDFVYENFNSFFLSLKHPHALTFFCLHFLNHSLVDKEIKKKKEQLKFLYETLYNKFFPSSL